ncbi:MAG: hypothetical protein ABI791_10995 [Acidobacteriota bacterium]
MFKTTKGYVSTWLPVVSFAAVALFIFLPVFTGTSVDRLVSCGVSASAIPTPVPPVYSGYKGVTIGMSTEQVRAKLGKARDTSDTEDYFVFSDNETAQVLYDNEKTAKVISVNYIGANPSAPQPKAVFGADTDAKPDGSVFKMVRYPKAGYWVSYNRTAGENAMIIVTMQKLPAGYAEQ